jgi:hypothetical protein
VGPENNDCNGWSLVSRIKQNRRAGNRLAFAAVFPGAG